MTCYFRQLKHVFEKAGIEVTSENRKEIDRVIQKITGTERMHCPDVWREVKKRITEDEAGFVSELKDAWNRRKKP